MPRLDEDAAHAGGDPFRLDREAGWIDERGIVAERAGPPIRELPVEHITLAHNKALRTRGRRYGLVEPAACKLSTPMSAAHKEPLSARRRENMPEAQLI
jgi:hypothetical protein